MHSFKYLDELLQRFTKENIPGLACGIAKDGDIIYEAYHGYADIDKGVEVSPESVFRLFSMTKVIVCTAAMILYDRGQFLLNEPLYEYIPEYKDIKVVVSDDGEQFTTAKAKNPILIKDAFMMTCGLPYPFGDQATSREMRRVQEQLKQQHGKYDLMTEVKAMSQIPLAAEPGTRWIYGYGHDLVAALVEVISGKSIGQFLQEEIFNPLGMKDTGYRYKGDIEERMVTLYNRDENGKFTTSQGFLDDRHQPDALYEGGGAGLYSTLKDYLIFTQMMANGGTWNGERIIGRKTIDLMRTNHLNESQMKDFTWSYSAGYGYGLGVRTMVDQAAGHSNSSIGEFGWTGAAGTWTSIDPSEKLSIVYMHQMFPNMEEYHHLRVRAAAYAAI